MPYYIKASSHLKCFPLLHRETLSAFLRLPNWVSVLNHWNNLFFQNKPQQLYVAVFYIHFYITMLLPISYWYRIKFFRINNNKYLLMLGPFSDFKFWNIISYLALHLRLIISITEIIPTSIHYNAINTLFFNI